jgi:hypothetical protein
MDNIEIPKRSQEPLSVRTVLFAGFLTFIPFSQALTINILFPLKLSEVFLVLIIIFELCTRGLLNWKLNRSVLMALMIFLAFITISLVVNIFYTYSYDLVQHVTRLSPEFDSFLKYCYILLAFAAMFATRYAFKINKNYSNFFFFGAILSCSYAWYLFFSGMFKIPVILLPGMDSWSQVYDIGFGDIIRSATFKEGNYMGFYCLVSGILATHYKKYKLAFFFFITIITTFSTTAIFCSLVFFIICLFHKYKKHKIKLIGALSLITLILVLSIQLSPGIRLLLYNKVFGNEETVQSSNDLFSKADRLNTVYVAIKIASQNPVFGVGPANFGLHFSHYNPFLDFEQDVKKIANNVYVEIFAECGSLAFFAFIGFLIMVYKYGRSKSYVLSAGLSAAFIYFFAFPTFTMLFIWVFLGIILT